MVTVLDTPKQITGACMLVQRQALKLEIKGMKRRGQSAYSIIKATYKLKGSKQSVFEQFTAMIEEIYPGVIQN